MLRPGSPYYLRRLAETPNPYLVIRNPHDGPADRTAGGSLFNEHCSACHGRDGRGGSHGPALVTGALRHGNSDWGIFRVIQRGIPAAAMPALELDDRDRWRIVAFVRSLRARHLQDTDGTSREIPATLAVSADRIRNAAAEPNNWLTYSGGYRGWRHTTLEQITPHNADRLQLAWARQLGSRGWVETTPLVVDGIMFITVPPSDVWALDAADGSVIWKTTNPIADNLPLCCSAANRGVAILGERVFVATLDGMLIALDAGTGTVEWQTRVASPADGFTLTVAPLAVEDKIIVGVSGGEFGIRGYLDAYNASDGSREWRFDTVPAPGQPGSETWGSGDAWRRGGGATWVTGSYDPDLGLLYWGVGNPAPDYDKSVRPGDNLFTDSVVALDVRTGELAWHYQFTPQDEHDYDANQTPVLVDVGYGQDMRRLLLMANRNGFFYVLNRANGEFVTARPFVEVTWAERIDGDGRPVRNPDALPSEKGVEVWPSMVGGTNWWPPSYSPADDLFFVSYLDASATFFREAVDESYDPGQGHRYMGGGTRLETPIRSGVKALEPLTGRVVWDFAVEPRDHTVQVGGVLSTTTGVVFQGNLETLYGLRSDDGSALWSVPLGGRINAAPISYAIDDRQFVALTAGSTIHAFALPAVSR